MPRRIAEGKRARILNAGERSITQCLQGRSNNLGAAPGELLTQFIEGAVCREAEFRAEQNAAIARAKVALHSAAKGVGLLSAEDFLAGMTQRAHTAQQRIREATAAKSKRTAG